MKKLVLFSMIAASVLLSQTSAFAYPLGHISNPGYSQTYTGTVFFETPESACQAGVEAEVKRECYQSGGTKISNLNIQVLQASVVQGSTFAGYVELFCKVQVEADCE